MSQHTSSMISNGVNPNSELKYQKALKQISKLINTNKILKNQCDQRQQTLGAQLSDIAMRYDQLSKKYDQLEHQKARMEQFIDELQQTNADMRKQSQTMARQVGYLNDVLNEQNVELKKLSVYKQQKGISQIFRSYEQSQTSYKREINRLQQHINSLKMTITTLQGDILQQKQLHERFQQQYNIVSQQVSKYRQLNTHLMNKHEQILSGSSKDKNFLKHKQLESFGIQFKRQLDALRQVKFEAEDHQKDYFAKNYQLLMEQNNNQVIQLAKLKDQLQIATSKINELYEVEQKMANTVVRSQVLNEQNNMLKNRITILQSKQLMQTLGFSIDCEFPEFQQKLHKMISCSDPLITIKNSDPSLHFTTMKSYITNLQYKLTSVIQQKKGIQKKYKSLKEKFMKKAEEYFVLEDSNKLMKGKLEGYERIAEKLNFELDRSVMAHEDEIVKMVAITNNLVDKKVEDSKKSMAFVKTQFDMEIEKAERTQKTLTQQLQSLKLQQSALVIKIRDLQQKLCASLQFNDIYQAKLNQLKGSYSQLQVHNNQLMQNISRLQLLYNSQKVQHQTILLQRQSLTTKSNQLSQELAENRYKWEDEIKKNEERFNNQLRRLRNQNSKYREDIQTFTKHNNKLTIELEQKRGNHQTNVHSLQLENQYYTQLEHNYQELKNTNKQLQTQLITNKSKVSAFDEIQKQLAALQVQIMKKRDQLNDQKRLSLLQKRELQTSLQTIKQQNQQISHLLQQVSNLRSKPTSQSLPSPSTKQLQSRRRIHHLSQQISILQSFVRDEKRNTSRVLNELNLIKEENQQLRNTVGRNKHNQEQLGNLLRDKDSQIQAVRERLKDENVRTQAKDSTIATLNNALAQAQNKLQTQNQDLNNTKAKLHKTQAKINQITRQLAQLKYYIVQADKMVTRLSSLQKLDWNQQRQKQNLTSLIQHLNRIIKANQTQSNDSSNQYSFVPSSSFGNFQSKSPTKILYNGYPLTNDSFAYQVSSSNYDSSANRFSKSSTSNEHISIKGY